MKTRHTSIAAVLCTAAIFLPLVGCGRTMTPVAYREVWKQHLGDSWYPYRAKVLGITPGQARVRDEGLSETEPPDESWDTMTYAEAGVIWAKQCASCHGMNGDPTTVEIPVVPPLDPAPPDLTGMGIGIGFTIGGGGMRAGLYEIIRDGGKNEDGTPTQMPAFGESLSREQMWALVFFIEGM